MPNSQQHWEQIYQSKNTNQVSWHQQNSTISLDWIMKYSSTDAFIIDVGSGTSVLVDNLLAKNYQQISLLELSTEALKITKKRLASNAKKVQFISQNILNYKPNQRFDVWHDRAVFHFLTTKSEQQNYINTLLIALKTGGYFILATFATTGPEQCSNLAVSKYNKQQISALLEADFKFIETATEQHKTPDGNTQDFAYFCFQKK